MNTLTHRKSKDKQNCLEQCWDKTRCNGRQSLNLSSLKKKKSYLIYLISSKRTVKILIPPFFIILSQSLVTVYMWESDIKYYLDVNKMFWMKFVIKGSGELHFCMQFLNCDTGKRLELYPSAVGQQWEQNFNLWCINPSQIEGQVDFKFVLGILVKLNVFFIIFDTQWLYKLKSTSKK